MKDLIIEHEAEEGCGGTYAIRWRARDFSGAMQQARIASALADQVKGFRVRRLSVSNRPGRGRATSCSMFVEVIDQRVADPELLKTVLREA